MAGELLRPGVKILQKSRTSSPSVVKPRLVPCVVGPAYEVINLLTADGAVNPKALHSAAYTQFKQTIAQSAFPNPRNNLDELNIQEASIRPFMKYAGKLTELLMAPGESFLASIDTSAKACIKSGSGATFALTDKTLIFALDLADPTDAAEYFTVTFSGTLSTQGVCDEINAVVGKTVATVVNTTKVLLSSPSFGAKSSVTISGAGTANSILTLGYISGAGKWQRVMGAGIRGMDDGDNDMLTPWVEFFRGDYLEGATAAALASTAFFASAFLTNVVTGTLTSAKAAAITFGTSGTIPIAAGDYVYADGVKVNGGEIMTVESTRFKVGVVNAPKSVVDAAGRYTSKVYDVSEVAVPTSTSPFSPTRVWFRATGLEFSSSNATSAYSLGSVTGTAATAASVVSGTLSDSATYTLGGLNLKGTVTVDGVDTDFTFTFTGGPYAGSPSAGTVESAAGPFDFRGLSSLTTFLQIAFDVGGNQSFTLSAVAAVVTGSGGATAAMSNETMEVQVGTDPVQTVTFGTEATIALQIALLNNQLVGCHAEAVDANNIKIVSDKRGTSARLRTSNVAAGITTKTGIANNADVSGSGDVADLGSVEASEIVTKLSTLTNGVASLDAGKVKLTSNTLGVLSTAKVNAASTADVVMGGQFATNATGTGAAASGGLDLVVAAIGSHIPGVAASKTTPAGDNTTLKFTTTKTGRLQGIKIKKTGTANTLLGYSTGADTSGTGTDIEIAALSGKTLNFKLNNRPKTYSVLFDSNSVAVAVAYVNLAVGADVASFGGNNLDQFLITSPLAGVGGAVEVVTGDAAAILGLSVAVGTAGTGRPLPDAYLDTDNSVVVGAEILRDSVTGWPVNETAQLYLQFKALRMDLSPLAAQAGVLRISDITALGTIMDPISTDNPLALGMFLAMSAAPGNEVKALGIDEVTAAAPYGTGDAYTRAAAMLEAEEVYAIAPLTQDDTVHAMFTTHVTYMSEPDQGGERVVIISKVQPTEAQAKTAASGTQGGSTATTDEFVLDVNPSPGLIDAGVNPSLPLPVSAGVYVEFEVAGALRRYNVSAASGSLLTLNVVFAAGENTDGFYTEAAFIEDVVNAAWSLKVRGSKLYVPSTTRTDYSLVADTVAAINAAIGSSRVVSVFPDTVTVPVDGVDQSVPSFYACAVLVGMTAGRQPQQGFTNAAIPGVKGVKDTGAEDKKFTKRMLDRMAGGGTFILLQDDTGGAVTCRQQVTTDTTTVEKREYSIIRCVDYTAKMVRQNIRKYIGSSNVDDGLINSLGATLQGVLSQLILEGVLKGAQVNNVAQDSANPDTVLVDITLKVPYPCNYIQVTLVV